MLTHVVLRCFFDLGEGQELLDVDGLCHCLILPPPNVARREWHE
jgi:hypothetical protein